METETSAAEPRPPPCVGFISPPGWFDPTPGEFPTVCAEPVRVQQCPLSLPGFDWRIDSIARTEPEMLSAARTLGEMGCTVVAKVGNAVRLGGGCRPPSRRTRVSTAWHWPRRCPPSCPGSRSSMHSTPSPRGASSCAAPITRTTGPNAGRDWFAPPASRVVAGQPLSTGTDGKSRRRGQRTLGSAPPTRSSNRFGGAASRPHPDADAIAVSGAGARTLALIHALEAETGAPCLRFPIRRCTGQPRGRPEFD